MPLPQCPHPLHGPLVRQLRHALARAVVAVPDDQMHMRVARIPAGGVNGRQPGRLAGGQIVGKRLDQAAPVLPTEFAGQRHDDLVDHAGVLAVALFLPVQPCPRRCRGGGHSRRLDQRRGRGARDIPHMCSGRPRGVGRSPHARQVQTVNRNRLLPDFSGGPRGAVRPLGKGGGVRHHTSCAPRDVPPVPACPPHLVSGPGGAFSARGILPVR